MTSKTLSDVQRDYRRYRAVVGDDGGFSSDVPAEVFDDVNDIFVKEALLETGRGFFLSANDRLVIDTAFHRLAKTVPRSGSEFADLIRSFVDDIKWWRAATTEARKEVKRQKALVFVSKKSAKFAHTDLGNLREQVAVSDKREAELLASGLASSVQMARATGELLQERDTISMHSK